MKWSDVKAGQTIRVKGEEWQVVSREGDSITMKHRTLGERTGSPDPNGEVELVKLDPLEDPEVGFKVRPQGYTDAKRDTDSFHAGAGERDPDDLARMERILKTANPPSDPDLDRLRDFASSEGYPKRQWADLDLPGLRDYISRKRAKQVAEDNDVTPMEVADAHVRLVLGATLIAELHTGEPPATPEVDKMDAQTMRNHLHYFHDTYPAADIELAELVTIHEQAKETERHQHSVPF